MDRIAAAESRPMGRVRRASIAIAIVIAIGVAGLAPGSARAQGAGGPIGPAASAPAPRLVAQEPVEFDPGVEPAALVAPPEEFAAPPPPPPGAPAYPVTMGVRDVIAESIFGPADKKDWKPLTLGTFFSEGWDQPYTNAPEGTNGAPKQNWIGAPSGVFGRFATVDSFYTNHLNNVPGVFLTPNAAFMPVHTFTTGNQYAGYATLLVPLNSRVELLLGTVFIDSRKSSPAGGYVGNWGDTGVQARFHFIEQRDFSLVGTIGERIPTGKSANGSDINYVTPGLEFWWNFAPKWVVRGGTSINILTGRRTGTSVYVNQLALGRYLTTKDAPVFKELEVHVTASALSDIAGGAKFVNDIYIFPGFRFGVGKGQKWYVLGGVNVPVSGPQPFAWQPQFSITRNY